MSTKISFYGPGVGAPEISAVLLGAENTGKTLLVQGIEASVGRTCPVNGYRVDHGDPLQGNTSAARLARFVEVLTQSPSETTRAPEVRAYHLFAGRENVASLNITDTRGQLLTHTGQSSPPDEVKLHALLMNDCRRADLLVPVVSIPALPGQAGDQLHRERLTTTARHLRASLEDRQGQLASVIVVITKCDLLGRTIEQIQEELARRLQHGFLDELVAVMDEYTEISSAFCYPISAMGIGNAVRTADARPTAEDAGDQEAQYILRTPRLQPFNVQSLVLEMFRAGLGLQPCSNGPTNELVSRRRELTRALADSWCIPLKLWAR
jgi:hypothetical protein